MSKTPRYLLDVNVLVALLDEDHVHHSLASEWFDTRGLQWALCPLTEAGFLRYMTRPKVGDMSVKEASRMLARLAEEPGYHYQPISAEWGSLASPFFKRVFGHNQITDAFLLGVAIQEELVLVTLDKAILHMAGEYRSHVLLLTEQTH
jgi:toxin-antitoxin system PIN domain toxin